jgi:hypothetical protein
MGSRALAEQLVRLRDQADAYRRGAIALDAKLRMLEPARRELHPLREQLAASSAQIDSAVHVLLERGHVRGRLPRKRR